jgi:hypothetical protein
MAVSAVVLGVLAGYGCIAPGQPSGSVPPNPPPPPAKPGEFVETFDSPAGLSRFQTQVSMFPPNIATWQADHDDHCSGPTAYRTIDANNPSSFIFWCGPTGPASGHMMTTMDTEGYAEIDFAPNQTVTNIKKVCWDQNQTELGERKWTQVAVVSEATYQANGGKLNYGDPLEQNAIHSQNVPLTGDSFMFVMLRGSTQTHVGQSIYDSNFDGNDPMIADKARRFRTCITDNENGQVTIELERQTSTEVRVMQGSFPNGPARVIFQDDSYDPPKSPPVLNVPNPFTWHWDNIAITT